MDKKTIERKSRSILQAILENQNTQGTLSLIGMIEPEMGARVLNILYEEVEVLGKFGSGRDDRFEVAGTLNRQDRIIQVSQRFSPAVRRFTGAHEIGHWVLHPDERMHRDRPIDGSKVSRNVMEREADYFASCFLMPRKLLWRVCEQTFGIDLPIKIDENIAFWLCRDEPDALLRPAMGSDICERALANAEFFNGKHFNSLAKQFRVSTTAMTIRLKELGIVIK